jgi:hypothetical protein
VTEQRFIILGAGLAALALLVLVKKNGIAGVAADAGAAVGEAVVNAGAGVVMGVGDAIGIPRTNETECEKAMREGRYWDASFACPAGDFIGGTASDAGSAISDWWKNF